MYVDKAKNHDGQALHADHTIARSNGGKLADRLLHGSCNASRGNGSRDSQRPALVSMELSREVREQHSSIDLSGIEIG